MYVTVFNPGDSPVVISERGNVLGGGEWAPAETTDSVCAAALDAGTLVKVDPPKVVDEAAGTLGSEASAALDAAARYAERADALSGLDKPALMKIATREHLVTRDEDPLRADLERRLIESDVDLKPKQAARQPSEKK